jgi:predicted lipoprotein
MALAVAAALAVIVAIAAACVDLPLGDGPRKRMLRDVAENVIAPQHAELAARTAALAAAVDALVAAPDAARLADVQAAWRAAREPWQEALVFRAGPVMEALFDSRIDQWPVDRARIEAEIAGAAELTPAYIGGLGANKKGFHAVEELLFDAAGGDAAVLAALTTGTAADRRRAYLAAAAALLATEAAALDGAWRDDFIVRVSDIGGAGPYATVKDATDDVVNEMVFLAELVADTKLGKPMGKASGGAPQLDLVQSAPSDGAIDDMLANLRGIRAAYEGTGSGGLGALVDRGSPATGRRVRAELAAAEAAVAAIPRPFAAAVAARAPEVDAAWEATRALRLTLATEVIAVLGATLSFNDNDGD